MALEYESSDSLSSSAASSDSGECSASFMLAVQRYLDGLPPKKRDKSFVDTCKKAGKITPESMGVSIREIKDRNSQQSSRKIVTNIVEPAVRVLKEYNGVINTLASADPMPTAIIWGVLNVVIDCANRHLDLFEAIQDQLTSLTSELKRITKYERLYGNSQAMRDALCDTYTYILQFWDKVYYECKRSGLKKIFRTLSSASLGKLKSTTEKIRASADIIDKEARLIEGEKADAERQSATIWRSVQSDDRYEAHFDKILFWLNCPDCQNLSDSNQRLVERLREGRSCDWLSEHTGYSMWQDGEQEPSVLWLHANPATGKSTLCSYVIDTIRKQCPNAAIAHHFYRFDQSFEAFKILKFFALQLFRTYRTVCNTGPPLDMQRLLAMTHDECTLDRVQELITMLSGALPRVYFILDGLDEELSGKRRQGDLGVVLDFLVQISTKDPGRIRLWCSSQYHPDLAKRLATHQILDVKEQMTSAVTNYLSNEVSMLPNHVSTEEKEFTLQQLRDRVEGNFLWAKLMMDEIADAQSEADMRRIIDENSSMDEYYKRFFRRFTDRDRQLACMVFALVAFARRPLKVKELNEAVAMLRSDNPKVLDPRQRVFVEKLQKLLAPLIVLRSDSDSESDSTCHLVHSTVRDFLLRHPDILRDEVHCNLYVYPGIIADACLRYLTQKRYAQPLTKQGDIWFDSGLSPVSDHHFLFYSAKYWDKHLDHVKDPPDDLRERVLTFVTSPHFVTCIQAQSLWVQNQFSVFNVVGMDTRIQFFRRVFPDWLIETEQGRHLRSNYHRFLHDWKTLLGERTGEIDRCWWGALGAHNFLSKHKGRYKSFRFHDDEQQSPEEDNVLNGLCFQGITSNGDGMKILRLRSVVGNDLKLTCEHWAQPTGEHPVLTDCQEIITTEAATNWSWYISTLPITDDATVSSVRDDRAWPAAFSEDVQHLRIGAQIFALGSDGKYAVMPGLDAEASQNYKYVEELAGRGRFIVVANRREVTSASSGEGPKNEAEKDDEKPDERHNDRERSDDDESGSESDVESDDQEEDGKSVKADVDDSDSEKDDDGSNSDDEGDNSESDDDEDGDEESSTESDLESKVSSDDESQAYESWSECSSDDTAGSQFEDDLVTPWACPGAASASDINTDTDDSSAQSESSGSGYQDNRKRRTNSMLKRAAQYAGSDADSDRSDGDDEPFLPREALIGFGQLRRDGDDDEDGMAWGGDDDGGDNPAFKHREILAQKRRLKKEKKAASYTLEASISVYDTTGELPPRRAFSFSQELAFVLYESPPVVHPSAPLVVWPLSAGGVLFGDFANNTYFVRKLRPSTPYTRHIFMKCHFSPCGRFLHIAALEGQRKPLLRTKHSRGKRGWARDTQLALLVASYRLCANAAARSPPRLIHRAKLRLGAVERVPVAPLPYTLTWAADGSAVFLTCSAEALRVYRVALFSGSGNAQCGDEDFIAVPRAHVDLPDSAVERKVHFFPPVLACTGSKAAAGAGRVILEAAADEPLFMVDAQDCAAPPIGCFVRAADLGGWTSSASCAPIARDRGVGKFDQHLEAFDSDEDCDLQLYTARN